MKQSLNNSRFPIFTERFRELQGNRSNTEFADFLGLSRQTVGFYCNGERVPDAIILCDIADRCGVSADWLLGRTDVKTVNPDTISVCSYTGLSEKAVNALYLVNTLPVLQDGALPGLDRLLASSNLPKLLFRLTAAFEFQDDAPSEELVQRAYLASKNPNLAKYEREYYALIHDDLSDKVSDRDLMEYRSQQALIAIIREGESGAK